jgi:hypothetical protein
MKRVGELLSNFFDQNLIKKAEGYSKLFSVWGKITAKCGIAAAADHSRIRELERCVLLIEADHPGWIQLLQTKQHRLLSDAQRRFPDLRITGISFMLSREPLGAPESASAGQMDAAVGEDEATTGQEISTEFQEPVEASPEVTVTGESAAGKAVANTATSGDPYAKIIDEGLRETLKRLEEGLKGK